MMQRHSTCQYFHLNILNVKLFLLHTHTYKYSKLRMKPYVFLQPTYYTTQQIWFNKLFLFFHISFLVSWICFYFHLHFSLGKLTSNRLLITRRSKYNWVVLLYTQYGKYTTAVCQTQIWICFYLNDAGVVLYHRHHHHHHIVHILNTVVWNI